MKFSFASLIQSTRELPPVTVSLSHCKKFVNKKSRIKRFRPRREEQSENLTLFLLLFLLLVMVHLQLVPATWSIASVISTVDIVVACRAVQVATIS
jgi:hypothetical protein